MAVCLTVGSWGAAGIPEARAAGLASIGAADGFTTLHLDYPQGENLSYTKQDALKARYADDKQPIPFSQYYDGMVFAAVPDEWKDRKVEIFSAEPVRFADYKEGQWEFTMLSDLASVGILKGNASGEAEPFRQISRAEAVTLMAKLMGIPITAGADSGFQDVKAGDWYADTVAAAVTYGIVAKDTDFNPNRLVTREEATTMAVNCFRRLGFIGEPQNVTAAQLKETLTVKDAESVSEYARQAYMAVQLSGIVDYVDTDVIDEDGGPVVEPFLNPKQAATRAEVCELIWRMMFQFPVYPSKLAIQYGVDEHMPVIDGSTSTYPFTTAVYGRLFYNGVMSPAMPRQHSKSHVSYERLISGEADMIFASVYPASDILALAKEKGVELELIPIAYDAQVFFTNAENSTDNLTIDQISNIYVNNAYVNWKELGGPDALLYPYCRNNDSGSHAQMERYFLNGGEINETIRRENTSRMMASILRDVNEAKTDDPKGYALGYSIYYYYQLISQLEYGDGLLKLLAINGVKPTDETIADGSYPLSNNTYVVLRKDTPKDAPARKLAEFMLTEAGQECVSAAGFGPLKPGK